MNKFIVTAILILFTLHSYAQNEDTRQGQVLTRNNQPIAYAAIQIVNKNISLQSDENGHFTFTAAVGDHIELQIKAVGYRTLKSSIRIEKSKSQYLFTLEESSVALSEVIVSGNNSTDMEMRSSQATVTLDKSYIEENFSGSLMQTLETVPGVKAMSIGSGQSKPAIRGLGFNRMIVSENGIKHEGQQWGEDHGLEIDQFAIDNIEIIKGPGSLLYGSDAIGGVISLRNNYIPQKAIEGRLNVFARSNNESIGLSAQLAGKKNKLFYQLSATLIDYADYKIPADSIQYYSYYIKLKDRRLRNTAGKEQNLGFVTGYLSDNIQTKLRLSNVYAKSGFFADAHGLEVRLSDIDYDKSARDIDLPYHSVNHLKVINNTTWRIDKISIDADLSYQNNLRKELSEPVSHGYMPIPPNSLERKFDKNVYSANISVKFSLAEKHSVNAGVNIEHQRNKRTGWGFIIPDFETTSLGAYLFDRYHISDDLIVSAGIRFDRIKTHIHSYRDWYKTPIEGSDSVYKERSADISRSFNSFTGSIGVNYKTGSWMLKANAGKSFRVPIAKELGADGVNYHIFRYEKGNADLSPEESYQFDAGISWQNGVIDVRVDPYINYFPNYIYLNPTSSYHEGLQMYYYRQSRVIRYGFEAEVSYKISENLAFDLQGEYLYAEQLSGDKKGYTLPFSPPWSAGLGCRYTPLAKWSGVDGFISVRYNIVGDQNKIVPPESKTKGHQTLAMSLGRSFDWKGYKLRVNLQGQNLLNKKYYDHTSYYRLIDVPEPGRNFSLMVGFEF